MIRPVLIALGSNILIDSSGLHGNLNSSISALRSCDNLRIIEMSSLYSTAPVGGGGRQPSYLNAVVAVSCAIPPARLLRLLKQIERAAGRRKRGLNAARPIDLDIIDFGGQSLSWRRPLRRKPSKGRARPHLMLPHPELHRRRFVLEPLIDVAPHWVHPVLKRSARQLVSGLGRPPGSIRRISGRGAAGTGPQWP